MKFKKSINRYKLKHQNTVVMRMEVFYSLVRQTLSVEIFQISFEDFFICTFLVVPRVPHCI